MANRQKHDDPEQSKRFVETARELDADKNENAFAVVISTISTSHPDRSDRKKKTR